MWRNRFITGSDPLNWEWELAKTPKEWWWDYLQTNPDYDPRKLDIEEGLQIYGSQFQGFKDELSRLEMEEGFIEEEELFPRLFMHNWFGESYKYRLAIKSLKPSSSKHFSVAREPNRLYPYYDPMVEIPEAYQHFCRLSHLVELGWSDKKVVKEIMKFVNIYGPPWYAEHAKLLTPPYGNPPNCPLTLDRILLESQEMDSAVKAYQLLSGLDEDVTAKRRLKEHMGKIFRRQDEYKFFYTLYRGYSGYAFEEVEISKRPRLETEVEISQAAIAFVMGSVNYALETTNVNFKLTSKLEKDNSLVGSWAPKFTSDSLLGTMWLQFYFQVLDIGRLRECANENCRRFFPVSRSNKAYCSKECGVKQYMRDHRRKPKEKNK